MELNGWISPQILRRYGARARRTYDRILDDSPRPDALTRIRGVEWQILARQSGVPVGWLVLMAASV